MDATYTKMELKTNDLDLNNMFMTFRYKEGEVAVFGYVITGKAFWTFVGGNNVGVLKEEEVTFPEMFMHGATRLALVHYVDGKKFAAYVPVFPTAAEMKRYDESFGR